MAREPDFRAGFSALICDKDQSGKVTTKFLDKSCSVDDLPAINDAANVTIRVTHSTINYKDGIVMSGLPGVATTWPIVPGIDFAGVVIEAAPDSPYQKGDEVILTGEIFVLSYIYIHTHLNIFQEH